MRKYSYTLDKKREKIKKRNLGRENENNAEEMRKKWNERLTSTTINY